MSLNRALAAFRDVSIRRKLALLVLMSSAFGLVFAAGPLVGYTWFKARAASLHDLESVTRITADNASGALAFNDTRTASLLLGALRSKPDIDSACLYSVDLAGRPDLFAKFIAPGAAACEREPAAEGASDELGTMVAVAPVIQSGDRIGWLQVSQNPRGLREALLTQVGFTLVILSVAFAISLALAFAMQRAIADPLLRLAAVARRVASSRDYNVRARKSGEDEVGVLVEDFNQMLDQIALSHLEIRRAEERFRLTVEAAPNSMFVVASDGRISLVNAQTETLFGYKREELLGQPVELLVPERFRRIHPGHRGEFFAHPAARSMGAGRDLYGRRKDGTEVPIEIGLSPIQTPEGPFVLASVIDITERKQAEAALKDLNQSLELQVDAKARALDQLQEAQAQLVQTEKLASLGALVAGVAHEINTPVGVGVTAASTLQARATQLQHQYETDTLRRSDLERFVALADESTQIILKNLQRAADLIHSFKQVAVDQSSGERRRFGLKAYLDEVLLSLRPRLKKTTHEVAVDCPESVVLDSYPGALAQILTNFVTNSLIHGFDNMQKGHIRVEVRQDREWVTLRYLDDGRGMAPEHVGRVFDPFFTTKRGSGGSGLGLHIVYNLVTRVLGGTVSVASEPGKGAEFVIRFPAQAQRAAA